jgi:hypothetical protein
VQLFKDKPRYGEVYAYRTLKPWWALILKRHWAYAGQTRNPAMRHVEHVQGGGRYGAVAKDWSDLDPRRYVIWRSAAVRNWRLNLAERLVILALLPVYNVTMNLANPRRITKSAAHAHRVRRDLGMPRLPSWRWFLALSVLLLAGVEWVR